MVTETPFLTFWRVMNRLRQIEGQPEWNYGEARDEWMARVAYAAFHIDALRRQRAGGKKLEVV